MNAAPFLLARRQEEGQRGKNWEERGKEMLRLALEWRIEEAVAPLARLPVCVRIERRSGEEKGERLLGGVYGVRVLDRPCVSYSLSFPSHAKEKKGAALGREEEIPRERRSMLALEEKLRAFVALSPATRRNEDEGEGSGCLEAWNNRGKCCFFLVAHRQEEDRRGGNEREEISKGAAALCSCEEEIEREGLAVWREWVSDREGERV